MPPPTWRAGVTAAAGAVQQDPATPSTTNEEIER
jgi:hypothetical protein